MVAKVNLTDSDRKALAAMGELVSHLYNIWIEMDACAKLAIAHGATTDEVEKAKRNALNDSETQASAREHFHDLLEAMKNARLVYEHADSFESLPTTDKLN